MLEDKTIVVWFSCGAASAIALYETLRCYGAANKVIAVSNPVIEEDVDNRRFLADVAAAFNVKIIPCYNPSYTHLSAEVIWEQRKYMSGIQGAPCTMLHGLSR